MAERPLYSVTCGDIGTKPENVEKCLERILYLSKIWGCVVLLNEAEAFLEQRTITDFKRNALVSVFFRIPEYHEGIVILTSNRVPTFDDAFKPRIHLSLHYENLNQGQRYKIWMNFLNRLKTMSNSPSTKITESGILPPKLVDPIEIDFDDIEGYIGELAKVEMNG
jgi:SpoVK/Ycf46/Vps4 family AAA+-type ATPase